MNYQSDIESLADRLRLALDDDWPDIMDEGSAEISEDYDTPNDTVRRDVEAAL